MKKIQTIITLIFSTVFSWIGILAIPVFLLLGCNIVDYITGLIAAKYRNPDADRPIDSRKSIHGIFKKVGMYALIAVGGAVDILVNYGLAQLPNYNLPFTFVIATVISVWLVFSELLSIVENLADIGTPIPPFLQPLLKMMKKKTEDSVKTDEIEQNEE